MKIKKTWFSYIIWILTTILSIALLVTFSKSFGAMFHLKFNSVYGIYALRACSIVLPAIICFLLHRFIPSFNKLELKKSHRVCLHTISLICMIVIFFVLRVSLIQNISDYSLISNSPFFEAAKIGTAGTIIEGTCKNTFYIYNSIVSSVFLFLGNKESVLLVIQLIIQFIATIAIYIAGRNWYEGIYGILPAWSITVAPLFLDRITKVDCSNLTLMMISLWLMLLSILCKGIKLNTIKICILGFLTGLLCDYWCAFLGFAFMAIVMLLEKREILLKNKLKITGFYILSAVIGYFIPNIIWPHSYGIYTYLQMHMQNQLFIGNINEASWIAFAIMAILMMCYLIAFWFEQYETGHIFLIPVIACVFFLIFSDAYRNAADFYMIFYLFVSFILVEMLRLTFTKNEKMLITEENSKTDVTFVKDDTSEAVVEVCAEEDANESVETEDNADTTDSIWNELASEVKEARKDYSTKKVDLTSKIQKEDSIIEEDHEEPVVIRVSDILASNKNIELKESQEEAIIDKKAPIENVLPLPKRHVNKVVEYSYEPSEAEMHYDIELTDETSDYDI